MAKGMESRGSNRHFLTHVPSGSLHDSHAWTSPLAHQRVSFNSKASSWWMTNVVWTYACILFSLKEKRITTHSTVHANLETMHTESQKSKYCVVYLYEQPKLAIVADVERRVEVATSIGYRSGGQCSMMRKSSRVLHNTVKILTPWDGMLSVG